MTTPNNDQQPVPSNYHEESSALRERVRALEERLNTELSHRPSRADFEKLAGDLKTAMSDAENRMIKWAIALILLAGGAGAGIARLAG